MKKNKGVTMLSLVITIILLLIVAGISIGTGNNVIKRSQLENLETNMLLIKVKAKEYVENANFKLGTNIENATDKDKKIEEAKKQLVGEIITQGDIFNGIDNITTQKIEEDKTNYIYYYKISTQDLTNMGLLNVYSDDEKGWYIIKYNIKNVETEIYNTKGFKNQNNKYYTLTQIQDINI